MSNKVSVPITNDLCPQTLFTYGTFKADGTPNFGLFCWFSYCWLDDLSVMCCIGAPKQTQDRIRATRVFSANLVTESNLALSDYFGTADGHDADKMDVPFQWERGQVLDVPVLTDCPFSFELEVEKIIPTNEAEGSTVFLCHIRNVLKDDADNIYREDILYHIAMSSYNYARLSVQAKQKERYLIFVDDYLNFVGEIPDSHYRKELDGVYRKAQKAMGKEVVEPDEDNNQKKN